jgi:hypothetical protein
MRNDVSRWAKVAAPRCEPSTSRSDALASTAASTARGVFVTRQLEGFQYRHASKVKRGLVQSGSDEGCLKVHHALQEGPRCGREPLRQVAAAARQYGLIVEADGTFLHSTLQSIDQRESKSPGVPEAMKTPSACQVSRRPASVAAVAMFALRQDQQLQPGRQRRKKGSASSSSSAMQASTPATSRLVAGFQSA